MINILNRTELLLNKEALKYCPEGTKPNAVVYQWLHAIAYDVTLYGAEVGVSPKYWHN